jgi:3,4-dihydroxy 2-butanone 4-phosphate synthase / GTP cyclohydrolase II
MGARALYGTLLAEGRQELGAAGGRFLVHRFRNLRSGEPALALTTGDVRDGAPLLARVHSSCVTSEALGACDCDCAGQLQAALRELAACGRGALFYLFQEGRGAGLAAKARDRMAVQASRERVTTFEAYAEMGLARDQRRYEEVAFLRRLLGIEAPLRLLTHNPEKAKALEEAGVAVADIVPLAPQLTPWNRHYLAAKARSGHAFADPGEGAAVLPEPLPAVAPGPTDPAGRFVRVARYLLPVLLPGRAAPLWLTLQLFYDLVARGERVLLEYRAGPGAALVCVQRETLLDRFAPGFAGARKPRWLTALQRFERNGAGVALFVPVGEAGSLDDETLDLLGARAGAGARPAFAEGEEDAARAPLAAALARASAA